MYEPIDVRPLLVPHPVVETRTLFALPSNLCIHSFRGKVKYGTFPAAHRANDPWPDHHFARPGVLVIGFTTFALNYPTRTCWLVTNQS
jgi:hypothetical protein